MIKKDFFKRTLIPYLVDPISGADLIEIENGLASPDHIFPIHDGIIHMIASQNGDPSVAYDDFCEAQGWTAPNEHTFRTLPREELPGWEPLYWKKRALSTANMWHVLEAKRRARREIPLGSLGIAVDICDGLPYIGYGLDVGGYITLAISPYTGRYGLGAYPYTRYGRIQAEVAALPLKPSQFDVIIFSGSLATADSATIQNAIDRAAAALALNGLIIVTDTPNTESIMQALKSCDLNITVRPIVDTEKSWLAALRDLRGKKIALSPLVIGERL